MHIIDFCETDLVATVDFLSILMTLVFQCFINLDKGEAYECSIILQYHPHHCMNVLCTSVARKSDNMKEI